MPVKGTINMEVGEEVLLYIRSSNPALGRLAKMKPFRLRVNYGVARNEFGPLGFMLFWVPYNASPENAVTIYDLYVNISNEPLMTLWLELAYQTHWHIFLLDEQDKQHGFWESTNTFLLKSALQEIAAYCKGVPLLDFDRAKEKFISETSLEALHAMTSHSEVNQGGVSIFDASNAAPSPPTYPNPLKSARFAGIIKESLANHSRVNSSGAADYQREKFTCLANELAPKTLIYLDVCHWINLLNVWLQSTKALAVYEKIVERLKFLAEESAVICPLSAPIFEELMKQADPLSRAATANLIESFSRGICVRGFKEALCEQWRDFVFGQGKSGNKFSDSITKIGFWLPAAVLKSMFWDPAVDSVWEKMSVDLRWNLTVDDYQRLVSLGEADKEEPPPFLAKWRGLPAEQRSNKSTFAELLKARRNDVLEAYSKDLFRTEDGGISASQSAGSIIEAADYGRVPCCEIVAGMCAAQVHRGGRVRENDVLDFVHAGVGIPSCRAYFCDRPMEYLLRNKPLGIDSYLGVTIRSRPEDLLGYLESVEPAPHSPKGDSA